jgi:hypothetical protein
MNLETEQKTFPQIPINPSLEIPYLFNIYGGINNT